MVSTQARFSVAQDIGGAADHQTMDNAVVTPILTQTGGEVAAGKVVRVLIIDVNAAYPRLCLRNLAKHSELVFEVSTVSTVLAGICKSEEQQFDCLLVDNSLVSDSENDAIRTLRSALGNVTPPIVVLSEDGSESERDVAMRAGAADFMPRQDVSARSLFRAVTNAVETGRLRRVNEAQTRELREARQKLQSKNDEIQNFYQTISHEVKTPLAAAREFVAIAMDGIVGPVSAKQKELLSHALDSCDQISAHVNDLIDVTKLHAGKIKLDIQLGSLDTVLARCLASVSSSVEAKNIYVKREIESPLPPVKFDCNRIIQALSNLLGNAIKYTEMAGTIVLSIRHDADYSYVEIGVTDSGCGVTATDLPRIFEPLYQVPNCGDEVMGAGLGLGLSIAKEIVALHGGKIRAESAIGVGSTFSFRLPVAQSGSKNLEN